MAISASEVNKLRQATGAGMMDCKKALQETGGDFDAAIDYLRKKGQKVAAKRADREANEGVVIALTSDDNKTGYVLHVTSETDFVAKNQDFIDFATAITEAAKAADAKTKEEVLELTIDGASVKEKLEEMVGKIGEKIELGRYDRVEGEMVIPYIHMGYKIGVLVSFNQAGNGEMSEVGKDIAMQIAAMNPVGIDEEDVPEEVKQKELEMGREQALAEGKPEQIVDKIAQGKLQKFFKDNTLLHQPFVKDSSKKVNEVLQAVDNDLKVLRFTRVSLGE